MLLASAACGLIQWKKLQLIREFEELTDLENFHPETHAFTSISPIFRENGWWPRVGNQGVDIYVMVNSPGVTVTIGDDIYLVPEARDVVATLSRRLTRIGIKKVRIAYEGAHYNDGVASELEEAIN